MAAQQKIAHGVEEHGFGDAGAMLFGAAFAQGINPMTAAQTNAAVAEQPVAARQPAPAAAPPPMSVGDQLDAVKKLKELLDVGILTQDEFDSKKKQILGL